ncbi:fasciclin domain-containing protein [Parapedobacter deserti]|uniref:Fasciclin domain-containing protein n=1 Tax=Parapedobacter deserti TaxID=1912957 RepID=A0ABV7JHV9_9SPHI
MKREKKYLYIIVALFCIIGTYSCKQEFFPPEVGAPIPIDQDDIVYPALLEALPETGYETFKAIWSRSGVKDVIAAGEYGKENFTYFVPNDEVMAAAGYTISTIQGMSDLSLDTLVRMHVMRSKVVIADLFPGTDLAFHSLLQIDELFITHQSSYVFRHYLHKTDDGLLHNGISMELFEEFSVNNGNAVLVGSVIALPDKQVIDVIKEDNRFNLFLKAMDLNVEMRVKFYEANWYTNAALMDRALYEHPFVLDENTIPSNYIPHLPSLTVFLPTDEAFHQVGIHTIEDLIAVSQRADLGDVSGDDWSGRETPLENILHLHTIRGSANVSITNNFQIPELPLYVQVSNSGASNSTFFKRDFLNPQFSKAAALASYDFGSSGSGKVTVQASGSAYEPATISETIMTWQGPVHIVDRLIIGEGTTL